MLPSRLRFPGLLVFVLMALASPLACAGEVAAASAPHARTLVLDGLGKGTAPLDGAWQFHLGDDMSWASPAFNDTDWEQLTADQPWGQQGHSNYADYAWYRRSISITPAPGVAPDIQLLIPAIDDVYEVYWNGIKVGQLGNMPPHMYWLSSLEPQIYNLGPARAGVLAIRVWKTPLPSNDPGTLGGFEGVPLVGSPEAIAAEKGSIQFEWLRHNQFRFGLVSLYALVAVLSFMFWLRDRSQWLLFWMTIFAITPLIELVLSGLELRYSTVTQICLQQVEINVREASQWFLLLWLLQLHESRKLLRFIRVAAIVAVIAGTIDGMLFYFYPNTLTTPQFQIGDAFLTIFSIGVEPIPALLVAWAIYSRKRLDSARWAVAIFAYLNSAYYFVSNSTAQGERFTHWTIADKMSTPLFTIAGNPINIPVVLRILLFLSIVYAVIRYSVTERRRQATFEREIQNARELQQILVPETFPALPGFTLTSAYLPAQEVGGDFFQIIPLEDGPDGNGSTHSGSTLVVLGDVSGKGLRAAMAVSLIVGAIRSLAEATSSPAEILSGLNRRLSGRMQGGFATAIALRIDRDGSCTMACAGHPAPFVNDRELSFPGALPLGLTPTAVFEETRLKLIERDQLALYTDGLLEARSHTGELYSFDRLRTLFATNPTAEQAAQAAVNFGQDDDITVLTLTRLEAESAASVMLF
jgi:serine phosphatase RsbU (regulator of sigma subunit)